MDEDLINEIGTEGVRQKLNALDPNDPSVQDQVKRIMGDRFELSRYSKEEG